MAAVFSPLASGDFEKVSRAFALGKILQTAAVAAGSVNTIYRIVSEHGVYFLRLEEGKEPGEVARELAFTSYLAAKRFPTPAPVPRPEKNLTQAERFLLPWKGRVISLTQEVAGLPLDPKDLEDFHLREIGGLLASLHQWSEGYAEKLQDRFGLPQIEKIFAAAKPGLSADLREYCEGIERELAFQKKLQARRDQLTKGVVHGDVFADNLFFTNGRLRALIDFDAAASRELLYDLTTAMNALCWDGGNFRWPALAALIQGYEEKRRLSVQERGQIIENWRLSSLRFTLTRIKDFHLRPAGKSGLIHRDFRDFYARLSIQQKLSAEGFWKKLGEEK